MLKLYKRIDGVLHYHEAWAAEESVIEHWGIAGERGQTKEHRLAKNTDIVELIERVLEGACDGGFVPLEDDDQAILLIEYSVDGFGSPQDLAKRHALEDKMNELLGWTGIGHCDGGSIGSGTMEICCYVADFEMAKRIIEAAKGDRIRQFHSHLPGR
jgi:hypothetical protein